MEGNLGSQVVVTSQTMCRQIVFDLTTEMPDLEKEVGRAEALREEAKE
jgi:hypothetical protein